MKRHSLKKASTFKLQGQKNKFQSFLEDIERCPIARKHPHLIERIKETSETVYSHCYTFRDDSPFNRGLNYGSKSMGFRFEDDVMHQKEWLPDVDSVFIMGEFNQFNAVSHKLERSEEDGQDWFKITLDLTGSHKQDDGSKVMLRVINHQGTEFYMIPPSCHIISQGYGIVKKSQILPISKKKLKIRELLAYTIDLSKLPLRKCLQFIETEQEILECYNTVILKNLFRNAYGLMFKYSIEFSQLQMLREVIMKIKSELGCKLVIEWSFEPGKMQYMSNPVEAKFLKQMDKDQYQFDLQKPEVMAYFISSASFFYQNLGIDGIHFTNIEHAAKSTEGTILIKCLNILNTRIIETGITLGSSADFIPALDGEITQGGCGFSFTYNHHQSLTLEDTHQQLYSVIKKVSDQSNCLAVDFSDFDESHVLNLMLVFMLSKRGVLSRGDFSKIKVELKKILKLRSQDKLFDNEVIKVKFLQNDQVLMIERGVSVILFNFSQEQLWVDVENYNQMEIIFTYQAETAEISGNKVKLPLRSCVLLENE